MNLYTLPDPAHSVLLTIDVQREFLREGSTGRDEKLEVIPCIKGITGLFRSKGLPIIHVVRIYLHDGSNADICRREEIEGGLAMLRPRSEEVQIVKDILPDPDVLLDESTLLHGDIQTIGPAEFILYKPRFGAFYRTPLEEFIRKDLGLESLVI
ncbi:MAG: cysteine hydrolase, partial [Synergistales bacterium]|nr:cysteine hydrolase [Synergistales bacterium]